MDVLQKAIKSAAIDELWILLADISEVLQLLIRDEGRVKTDLKVIVYHSLYCMIRAEIDERMAAEL